MQFISFIRFDIISAIIFLCTIVLSFVKNQTKCWTRTISLILSLGLVGCFVYFNWFNLVNVGMSFLDKHVFTPVCDFMKYGQEYHDLFAFLVILLLVFIVELLFISILKLCGAGGKYKYKRYPSYAKVHKPFVGFISGLIRGLINVYILYLIWSFLAPTKGLSMDNDLLYGLINKFDPILNKLKELISSFLGA